MNGRLEDLLGGRNLSEDEAADLLVSLTDEDTPRSLAGAILIALRAKGETPEEVRGFARAMRALAVRPDLPVGPAAVDIVGTGGDGSGSLNLSTGAALLTAACGQPVIKHGNRSISSRSGSADVLAELGMAVPLEAGDAGRCLARTGFTFLFAPRYHPAMKSLAPVRRALGVRTVFNLLGPLTNPAAPPYYSLGAFNVGAARLMAEAMSGLPIERAFVVHGHPGWDEATPAGPFTLFDVRPGSVRREERTAEDYGLPRCAAEDLAGGCPADNAASLREALSGAAGPHQDALVLGAALALEVTGGALSPREAAATARSAIEDGSAARLVRSLSEFGPAAGTDPETHTTRAEAETARA